MKKRIQGPRRKKTLRARAEKRLEEKPGVIDHFLRQDPRKLVKELGVQKIELELQNDELRQTQEELEKSRAKYFDLYDLAPVGYFTLAEDGQILETNLKAGALLGVEKGNLLNKNFNSFVALGFRDAFFFHARKVIRTGLQQSCELQIIKNGGEPFFVHIESIPVPCSKSHTRQIRTSVIDINEKKLAEEVLKERAGKNELLLNLLPHPAMLIDKDRRILAANQLAKRNGAVIGKFWLPNSAGNKGTEKGDFEKSGKLNFNGARGKPSHDVNMPDLSRFTHSGNLNGAFFESVFSFSDREKNQQRLVTVVEDSNDAVTVLDFDGNIKAWNKRAEKIYGYSPSEALKMKIFDLIPPGLKRETQSLLNDIESGVLVKPFETKRVAKDGCIVDIRLTVTRLIQNERIVAVATTERDVTEYNRWLASIKELPQRIILAQEKERSRISQEIHSDFGQSLMALKMFICMSESEFDKDPLLNKMFEKVREQLSLIIDKARDLSHQLAPPSLKYIGLMEAMRKLVESAGYDKNLKIHFIHRNMDGVTFESRDIIIYRIVQEALNNIAKHARATEVWIRAICRDSRFSIEVDDNGKGFDPLKTTMSRCLGLDLMKEQAALVNGTLKIESQIGKGTKIVMTVPIKERKKK